MPAPSRPIEPWPCDQPLPSVMTPGELQRVLGIRSSAFHQNQRAGLYRHLQVKQPHGLQRYSGYLVDQFRRGESTVRYGFGARRTA